MAGAKRNKQEKKRDKRMCKIIDLAHKLEHSKRAKGQRISDLSEMRDYFGGLAQNLEHFGQ